MQYLESALSHLSCSRCEATLEADLVHRFCTSCGGPLYPRYDLSRVDWSGGALAERPGGLWRYADLLPVRAQEHRLCLGEGGTPMLHLARLGPSLGLEELLASVKANGGIEGLDTTNFIDLATG